MSSKDGTNYKKDTMTSENIEMENREQKCKLCSGMIPKDASVCMHCQRNQKWIVRHFQNVGVLVSIGLLLIAGLQLYFANNERILAKNSAEMASEAKRQTEAIVLRFESLKKEVNQDFKLADKIAKNALSNAEENYDKIVSTQKQLREERIELLKSWISFYDTEIEKIKQDRRVGGITSQERFNMIMRMGDLSQKLGIFQQQLNNLESASQ